MQDLYIGRAPFLRAAPKRLMISLSRVVQGAATNQGRPVFVECRSRLARRRQDPECPDIASTFAARTYLFEEGDVETA